MPSAAEELDVISSDLNDWNDCSSSSSPLASLSSEGCFNTGPGGSGRVDGVASTSGWPIVLCSMSAVRRVVGCNQGAIPQRTDEYLWYCGK